MGVVYMQIAPWLAADATTETPPDLPSYLFKERIVYLVRLNSLLVSRQLNML